MRQHVKSIGTRLSRVVVLAVLAGILCSVSFFLLTEFRQTVLAEQARLRSSAAAFAAAAAPGVRERDERAALTVLRGIRELPEVRHAAARAADGAVVAELGQAAMLEGRDTRLRDASFWSLLTAETLSVSADIRHGGLVIGSLTMVAEISSVRSRYLGALQVSLLFVAGLTLVTSLFARAQTARIIRPLGALAAELGDIGERSDLTRRLSKERPDEIGVLVDAFNEMFGHIERRDRQLQRHRDTLEQTVEERTGELRVAKEEAERANAAKSDFLATMSHEIRTPMNGMMVMAEMLSAAPLAPKHLRYAEIIRRSGRGLLGIINDILDFSKIEAGMLSLEAIPFSLDAAVEDTASLFAERAREKGLAIALFVAPDLPRTCIGDPTRLGQVIGNLVNNALKFTETGGVTVEVLRSGRAVGEGSVGIEVHVRDTGIGISAEKRDRIFERFSQADQTITRRYGGTGLGLSISRRLVEAMGGELTVESEVGRGSDFFFRLALAVAEASPEPVRLEGKRVFVAAAAGLAQAAVARAFSARGATLVAEAAAPLDLVMAEAGQEFCAAAEAPIVLLRPFAAAGGALPTASNVVGEIALPLGRGELDAVASALASGDWTGLRSRSEGRQAPLSLPDLGGLRVLAVDDTAVNREVLGEALAGFNIRADMAESGPEAIERFGERPYDVVFMDCSMPGMDGFTATARLRELERAGGREPALIVALTAHVTGPEAKRWQEAGMDAYVAKPFTIAQIGEVLASRAPSPAGAVAEAERAGPAPGSPVSDKDARAERPPLLSPETLDMFESLSAAKGQALAGRVFGLFRTHAPGALDNLRAGLDGPPAEAAKLAHALKSMCLSAGAARAGALCGAIEDGCKNGVAAPKRALAELEAALGETADAMTAYLERREANSLAG
ncbi:MAG TPA: ATP-binding protein [Mesorhizobium sp.]|jgi:two-component system sensor histidine kinase BarA|nr:ATP-binding protein [Mesorhizobium sp.]